MWRNIIIPLLPQEIAQVIRRLSDGRAGQVREIRIRSGKPIMLVMAEEDKYILKNGDISGRVENALNVTAAQCRQIFDAATHHSAYTAEEERKHGYITLAGGCRMGICGGTAASEGYPVRDITYINIRIARQLPGAADGVMKFIRKQNGIYNTLVLSAPGLGKTTLLRDIARQLSDGIGGRAFRVGIVEERSEIAGSYKGVAQLDVGMRTDVLDGCPKAMGIQRMVRSMSPQVIITDEIGTRQDARALREALCSGVGIVASAHAGVARGVDDNPVLTDMVGEHLFSRLILIGKDGVPGRVEKIISL